VPLQQQLLFTWKNRATREAAVHQPGSEREGLTNKYIKVSAESISVITHCQFACSPAEVGAATNTPLFDGMDVTSEIHAEINALALVCRSSQSTEGCTAYIPIHPCKQCFAALETFGTRRIVCRRESTLLICQTAAARNIEVSHLSYQQQRCQMKRIYQLVNDERTDEQLMEIAMHIQQQAWRLKDSRMRWFESRRRLGTSPVINKD
jgi:tRNA(Arg) A34 adenosine deaminase TadA